LSTVAQLIGRENIRRAAQAQPQPQLRVDRDCLFTLKYQQLAPDSIPADGQKVVVKNVDSPTSSETEVRTVYNTTVTDEIGDSVRANAEAAAEALGSRMLGVDVITADPSVSLEQSGGAIVEVNTTPGLHHHYDITLESYPRVATQAISMVLDRR
jgi:cyanophycin synthetase